MRVFVPLYGIIWLGLFAFLTALVFPRGWVTTWTHIAIGVGVMALAFQNARLVDASRAPLRTKRIARIAWRMAGGAAVTGALMQLDILPTLGLMRGGIVVVLHVVFAMALITQVASIATSYDMWEEKESVDSEAGPAPAKAPQPGPSHAY